MKKRSGKKMSLSTLSSVTNTNKQSNSSQKRLTAEELVKRNASRDYAGKTFESQYKEGK